MKKAPTLLLDNFVATRRQSEALCAPLAPDDYSLQAEAFTSPPKWHLAHSTWFFETFLLKPYLTGYRIRNPLYEVLFNSYYNGIGKQFPRPQRGLLSRPTVAEVLAYRYQVDQAMIELLSDVNHWQRKHIHARCTLGIAHEQQHQELFLMDLKYSLALNPLYPRYCKPAPVAERPETPLRWLEYAGGLTEIGHTGKGFAFDNEGPRHKTYLEPYALTNRLITNADYQQFIDDGGYQQPALWLADGWATVCEQSWRAPLYWCERDGEPLEYSLHGLLPRQPQQPVCHISGYEADAFARWAGARLPSEMEWEHAAVGLPVAAAGVDSGRLQPLPAAAGEGLLQLYSDCWQWTRSAYAPYPGFQPAAGAIGEYNGKFMSNQWVLRGGCCVSKKQHLRPSYRNFFYLRDRWQFGGLRLAKDLK